jgi:tetratricopeptide (TPR) repeat protein
MDPIASRLKEQGDVAIEEGKYALALEAYAKALGIESCPNLYYNRGRALQGLGRNAEALADFEQFQRAAPADLIARVPHLEEMMSFVRGKVSEIIVHCDVQQAVLTVKGQVMSLPLKEPLRIDPDTVEIQVTAPHYETWSTVVTLKGGEQQEIAPKLRPVDSTGNIVVGSPTTGAVVQVDGKVIGMVPVELRLEAGSHVIALNHTDYKSAQSRVILRPGENRTINVTLEKVTPWYKTWWFWTGVSVVAVTGTAFGVALVTEKSPDKGDIPPGRIKMPLVTW